MIGFLCVSCAPMTLSTTVSINTFLIMEAMGTSKGEVSKILTNICLYIFNLTCALVSYFEMYFKTTGQDRVGFKSTFSLQMESMS
jgi:4-hydroxy-3-methylbut-2-enyl diphosphate reductase IspH